VITLEEKHGELKNILKDMGKALIAYSGGVDSMVLLYLLTLLRGIFDLDLIVAHVNHGLRQEESEKEAALVCNEAGRLKISAEYPDQSYDGSYPEQRLPPYGIKINAGELTGELKEMAEKNLSQGKVFMEENKKKEGVKILPSGLQYILLKNYTPRIRVNCHCPWIFYHRAKPVPIA
jgi:3'-phosphoadenosine 5'-phosphosulfate sulfotransferase (PAPS reductase)/FAD synthetase